MRAPDHDKYPRFKEAAYLEAVLGPGDLLFMPKVRVCTAPRFE